MKNKTLKSLRQAATILAGLRKTSDHLMVKKFQGERNYTTTIQRDPNSKTSIYGRLKEAYRKDPVNTKKQVEGLLKSNLT